MKYAYTEIKHVQITVDMSLKDIDTILKMSEREGLELSYPEREVINALRNVRQRGINQAAAMFEGEGRDV